MSARTRRVRRRRGIAAAEAAIVLPVFVILAFGALETCSAIFTWQSVSVAAYEGARVATRPFAYHDQVMTHCDSVLGARDVVDYTVTVSAGGAVVTDLSTITPGTPVTVVASAPANQNAILLLPIFAGRTIEHSVTMLKE